MAADIYIFTCKTTEGSSRQQVQQLSRHRDDEIVAFRDQRCQAAVDGEKSGTGSR